LAKRTLNLPMGSDVEGIGTAIGAVMRDDWLALLEEAA